MREFLERMAAEIEAERAGLEKRYRSQVSDAGFLVEALENGDASAGSGTREQALASSIMRCEQRLAELSRQKDQVLRVVQSLGCSTEGTWTQVTGPSAPGGPR